MPNKIRDLTGQRFGRLIVLELGKKTKRPNGTTVIYWKCQCDCGNIIEVRSQSLISGNTKSCSCYKIENTKKRTTKDLTGKRFGKVIALYPCGSKKGIGVIWKCQCDCGALCEISSKSLLSGDCRSCGCLYKEYSKHPKHITHDKSNTNIYHIWAGMKQRCLNPNCEGYKYYGGRGIKICTEWKTDFQKFYEWAINNGYQKGLSIERIDVNGNYCPENCTWIPLPDQGTNKRTVRKVEFKGEELTLKQWEIKTGIPSNTLYCRLYRYNWDVQRALTESVKTLPLEK